MSDTDRQLADLRARATAYIEPEAIEVWLDTPNAAFDGRTPRRVVEDGDGHLIEEMLVRLEQGICS